MTLNIGIIGTGGIVERGHAAALASTSSACLWSFLSRDLKRAEEFAKRFQAQAPNPAYASMQDFLADPQLDAVIVATPDKLHRQQAVAAARAGKHVLLEKPMATDQAGIEEITKTIEQHNLTLGLCYRLRWHAGHRKIISMAHQGVFGELRHVRTLWAELAPDASNWRAHEELGHWWSLAAVGTHCFDLTRWALLPSAGEVKKMQSIVSRKVWKGPHDETAVLAIEFETGATAEVCSSFLFNAPTRFEIYGTKGFAICENTFDRKGGGRIWTHEGQVEFENLNPFVGLIEDFASAVINARDPEVSGREGSRNVELLLSIKM